jgi:hypothetical protein
MSEPEKDRPAPEAPYPAARRAWSPPAETADADPRIEDYLDHVCAPLVGRVAYAERAALRAELRAHLEALVAASQEVGMEADTAVRDALVRFGPPHVLARQWLRARGVLSARPATLIGLACFGAASGVSYMLALLSMVYAGDIGGLGTLPMLLAGPILAGLATGWMAPARHALGAFYALAMVIGPTALGLGLLAAADPKRFWTEIIGVTVAQGFLWIPLGCATAAFGGWLRGLRDAALHHWTLPA